MPGRSEKSGAFSLILAVELNLPSSADAGMKKAAAKSADSKAVEINFIYVFLLFLPQNCLFLYTVRVGAAELFDNCAANFEWLNFSVAAVNDLATGSYQHRIRHWPLQLRIKEISEAVRS